MGKADNLRRSEPTTLDRHTAYFNILDALSQPGCAVCRSSHEAEVRFVRDMLYGKATVVKTRVEMREARGLCADHSRLLCQVGHALDVSIFYQDILQNLSELLTSFSARASRWRAGKKLSGVLAPRAPCPACVHRAEFERIYVETLLDHLPDPDFVERVQGGDPLCLSHFRQALETAPSGEHVAILCQVQLAHWERLVVELGEFIRKNDYRFHDEPIGAEGDAWLRAVDAIAGTRQF